MRLRGTPLPALALVPALTWLFPSLLQRLAPSFRDQGDFFYPLKLYTAGRIAKGEIPLWNPLSGTGEPWLANAQSGVFYPPTLLFLIPSPALAAGLFLLLHFAIGVFGMRHFLKEEGATDAAALFGATVFAGCGFAASLSAYWNHFGAAMYLPAIAALARSGLRSRAALLGLSALIGLQAMAGSPELSAGGLLLAFVLVLKARKEPESGWEKPHRLLPLSRYAIAAVLGLALAAWVLVPLSELLLHSDRRTALSPAQRELGTVGLAELSSLLGLSGEGNSYYLASLFLGPLPLVAAGAAFLERQRRGLVLLLCLLAVAGVLFSAASPPGTWLRAIPPLDRFRYPAKALSVTAFAVAALAGLGLDSLRFSRLSGRALLLFSLAAAAGVLLLLLSPLAPSVRLCAGAGLLALLLLAALRGRFPAIAAWAQGGAAAGLIVSLALASRSVFRFAPEAELTRVPPDTSFLAGIAGRVLTPPARELSAWVIRDESFGAETLRRQRKALLGYTNLLSGVRTVRTAAALPVAAARRIAESLNASEDLERTARGVSARLLWMPYQPKALGSGKVGEFFHAPLNPYLPRLSFVSESRREADPGRAWELIASGRINPEREVVLERDPPRQDRGVRRKGLVIANIAEDRPEHVVANVTSRSSGFLVLTDLAYPGWTAEADGRPAEILRANGFCRAVALPAGTHRIVFRYRPLSFYAGAAISLAALAASLFLFLQGEPVPRGRRE